MGVFATALGHADAGWPEPLRRTRRSCDCAAWHAQSAAAAPPAQAARPPHAAERAAPDALHTERMGRFITALAASKLSSSLLYSSHWGLRFRLVARWADDEYAEHVLQTCVQQLCVSWYLTRYTNYSQALEQHVREFGHYSQAANVVAQHYPLPTQWPWLHANV